MSIIEIPILYTFIYIYYMSIASNKNILYLKIYTDNFPNQSRFFKYKKSFIQVSWFSTIVPFSTKKPHISSTGHYTLN